MTRAATFREADVRRAIKAAEASGLSVAGVEVSREGTIRVLTGPSIKSHVGEDPAVVAWETKHGLRAA